MKNKTQKSGQKILNKFSRAFSKAEQNGKEHIKENFISRFSHVTEVWLLVLEWGLLVLALVMLAVTQAFWFGDSYAETVYVDGGSYIEGTIGKVSSFNPIFATTSSEKTLSRLLFSTLVTVDYSGHIGNGLTASITPNENGKIWTIKLKEGLKWSDGEELTNEDVLFTIDLIKNPAVSSIYDSNLTGVKIETNEADEIVFKLPSPYADFTSVLDIPILPKHLLEDADPKTLIEDNFSVNPVSSGPFMFNAMQVTSENEKVIYLSKNPYYDGDAAMVSSFAIHTFEDKDSIVNALNTGSITATAELSGAEAERITSGQIYRREASVNSAAFIFFNLSSPVLKDTAVRAAIRQGIDLSALRAAAPDTISIDYPILSSTLETLTYPEMPGRDFETAKAKIGESIEEGTQINIVTVKNGYLPTVAEALKTELSNLGIESEVTEYEENQDFVTNTIAKRNYDILLYEIELEADPDPLAYYHSSQISSAGLNLSNYRNAMVDDLLIGARETLDTKLRAAKYESFLKYILQDVPTIGVYQANMTYYYNKNVRIFSNNVRLVTALDRFSDIQNFAVMRETKNKTP